MAKRVSSLQLKAPEKKAPVEPEPVPPEEEPLDVEDLEGFYNPTEADRGLENEEVGSTQGEEEKSPSVDVSEPQGDDKEDAEEEYDADEEGNWE